MNLSDAESLFQHLYLMLWRPAGGNLFVAIPAHFLPLVGMDQQPPPDGIGQRTGIARLEERPRQALTDGLELGHLMGKVVMSDDRRAISHAVDGRQPHVAGRDAEICLADETGIHGLVIAGTMEPHPFLHTKLGSLTTKSGLLLTVADEREVKVETILTTERDSLEQQVETLHGRQPPDEDDVRVPIAEIMKIG